MKNSTEYNVVATRVSCLEAEKLFLQKMSYETKWILEETESRIKLLDAQIEAEKRYAATLS